MEFISYDGPPAPKPKRQIKGTEEKRTKDRDYQTMYRAKKLADQPISLKTTSGFSVPTPLDFPILPSNFMTKWCIKHTLANMDEPPVFHLTPYASKPNNKLNFLKLVDPYGRRYGCVHLVPFPENNTPNWMEKDIQLDGGKIVGVGDQFLPGVHRQTYEYPDKDGNGFDGVIQVRNLPRNTRKKISTWMGDIERGTGFETVEEVVEELVAIAESDTVSCKLYGADQETTLINMGRSQLGFINTDENLLFHDGGKQYAGIHTPYLYFGTPGTAFTWHLEDWLLPSANHLLSGAPKVWYVIPPSSLKGFETSCTEMFKELYPTDEFENIRFGCPQYIKHERLLFAGKRVSSAKEDVEANGYQCYTVKQEAGHLIIIWPGAYHSGINMGYNLAEAANYAHKSWTNLAETQPVCACDDTFKEPMMFNIEQMIKASKEGGITKARCSRV